MRRPPAPGGGNGCWYGHRVTQPLNVPRKLRQLDNDVQSVYGMLTGIAGTQLRHGNRLDELAASRREVTS